MEDKEMYWLLFKATGKIEYYLKWKGVDINVES
jgi:hypothetical protein